MDDVLEGCAGGVSWGGGVNREVYYSTMDDAHRPDKVWRHTMGTPQSSDVCVLEEPDELFNVGFSRTSSGRYMMLESEYTDENECNASIWTPRTRRRMCVLCKSDRHSIGTTWNIEVIRFTC